ncbi:HpcH/HpaI aldolase family protein [Paraburkholderia sp. RL17-347-BIC-D]|uniref:HpcH/HpaI aldolase family protein n=1 Tax=Paraburkholderia sp. RL17-347-BIC-D TaxID=3031632 RepID=UPI0038BAC5B7
MRAIQRNIRGKLSNNERSYGIAIQLPCPEIVEIVGATGYDFAWIDAEHGCFSLSEIRDLIRSADAFDIDSIVRVPSHDVTFIQRVLDLGATGILVPHIRTVEDGIAVAAATRYGPSGTRGACPGTRAVGHVTEDWVSDYQRADQDVLIFGLIEDLEGMENVDAIARECGFDGLMYGPFDLSMALGLKGDVTHPTVRKMHDRVIEATRAAGIEYVASNASWESDLEASGARIIAVAGDRFALFNSFRQGLADVKCRFSTEGNDTSQV